MAQVVAGYWLSVKPRHTRKGGKLSSHGVGLRTALRELRIHAGDYAAIDYGPKLLQETRRRMADSGRFNRNTVNQHAQTIVRAFRWAVAEEMVPASVPDALACVVTLTVCAKGGKSPAFRTLTSKPFFPTSLAKSQRSSSCSV